MRHMRNTQERLLLIKKMLAILQIDAPWMWGIHPTQYVLFHQWNRPSQHHAVANNTLKYMAIDSRLRAKRQKQWNTPIVWPLYALLVVFVILLVPAVIQFWRKETTKLRGEL